jgi:hypothetical protein
MNNRDLLTDVFQESGVSDIIINYEQMNRKLTKDL